MAGQVDRDEQENKRGEIMRSDGGRVRGKWSDGEV